MIQCQQNDRLRKLLDGVPELPTDRYTKDELVEWAAAQHQLLTDVRTILLDLMSRSLLVIGDNGE